MFPAKRGGGKSFDKSVLIGREMNEEQNFIIEYEVKANIIKGNVEDIHK
jgi:hypothetical protein